LIALLDTLMETIEHTPVGPSVEEMFVDEAPKVVTKFPYDGCIHLVDEVLGDTEVSTIDEVLGDISTIDEVPRDTKGSRVVTKFTDDSRP